MWDQLHIDEIEIVIMPDVNSRTVALKTGQVDVTNRPDRKTAHLLGRTPGLQLVNVPDALHLALILFGVNRWCLRYYVDISIFREF